MLALIGTVMSAINVTPRSGAELSKSSSFAEMV
jgi:hypothetical protein